MTVTFPRDLVLEAYLGRWVEITALPVDKGLRQEEPVTVTWGSNAEQGKVPPSTVEGALNNFGGHWTPGNAMSDYYAYLQARNVPTRLSLRVGRDTFSRTVVGAWGLPDTETSFWSLSGGTFDVAAGLGTMTVAAANSYQYALFPDRYPNAQVAVTASWNMNVAGGAIEPCDLILRHVPTGAFAGEHYMLRVSVSAAEVLTVAIFHSTLGLISQTITLNTLTPGANSIRGKFQVEGQTLRGKAYPPGPSNDPDQFEPLGWQVSAHHERLAGGFLPADAGFVGIRTGVASGNTNVPVTVGYDDWEVRLVRHTGELQKLAPTWDVTHKIKKAAFTSADVTMRLGRPQRPALSSAPRRYLAKNNEFTATDFWPLDETATASVKGRSATGGVPATFQREFDGVQDRGAVRWGGADQVLTSVPAFVSLNNGGQLTCATNTTPLPSVWSAMWAMRLSSDSGAKVFFHTSTTSHFVFFLYTDGTYELFRNPGSVSLATGTLTPSGLDGVWTTLGLTIFDNGGGTNVGFHLNVDGQTLGVSTWSGAEAYSALRSVVLYVPQATTGGQGDGSFSSLFVTSQRFDTIISGTTVSVGARASNVLKGWPGERAGIRAFRLCAEEGVPFDYWGDLATTGPMGPQCPVPLLDQLQECADVIDGVLYAPRYSAGVGLRSRASMSAQPATATLSYSGGHVAPVFAPSADGRHAANLVRAERVGGGGFVIAEQTTGPMNTKDPGTDPDAIGVVPTGVKVNVESDAQLPNAASWARALGTVPDVRYPRVTVDLGARELTLGTDPTLPARQVLQLGVGDRLLVTGLQAADQYRDLDQLVRGGTEVYRDVYGHKVTLNTAPYEKYRTAVYGDAESRYADMGGTTLDSSLTTTATGARNVTTSIGERWTNDAGAYPLDVDIEGERVTLSGTTGAGAAQVMTISARSVNGVVKAHPAGAVVRLWQPSYYG